jgi:hypothetical protein
MKTYKYSELCETAQLLAMADYQRGWFETHEDEMFTIQELHGFLMDGNDEFEYTELGELIQD